MLEYSNNKTVALLSRLSKIVEKKKKNGSNKHCSNKSTKLFTQKEISFWKPLLVLIAKEIHSLKEEGVAFFYSKKWFDNANNFSKKFLINKFVNEQTNVVFVTLTNWKEFFILNDLNC